MTTPKTATLPFADVLLAIAVAAVWGSNFVVIKIALTDLPPLLLATLRFALAFLPAAFFVKRPDAPWSRLALYGVLIGAGQFGLLYIAMRHDISPGLASIVIQMQVFFTIALSIGLLKEHVHLFQWAALALAAAGLGLILINSGDEVTGLGLALTLVAAASWGAGNVVARATGVTNMLGFVIWSSAFAVPPLLVLSLVFEGPNTIAAALGHARAVTWAAVLYQSIGNTLFGYASWGWLLARHRAATVSPFALLVPVVGLATSVVVMAEPLQSWKLVAAALVMSGLALNLAWPRLGAMLRLNASRADRVHPP